MAYDSNSARGGSAGVEVVDVTGKVVESKPPYVSSLRHPEAKADTAVANTRWQVVATRQNATYAVRAEQLEINLLALAGGQPYVDERLSRFAGESKIDWDGGTRADGTPVTGRRKQAHCIPYPGRIAAKISQYVFSQPIQREGGDEEFLADVTRDGQSIDEFMKRVNDQITACGWCWIGIDAPEFDPNTTNLQQRQQQKLRPYWRLYNAAEVVDWKFAPDGALLWLLTEEVEKDSGVDPFKEGTETKVRNLWQPGLRTRYEFKDGKVVKEVQYKFTLQVVPFVPVGTISPDPHLFDSIESINRTIMDLESCSRQNFFERVFPQMYLPSGAVAAAARVWSVQESQAAEMIVGMAYPILVDKDDVVPGYCQPNAADLAQIDTKTRQLKEDMFECVGLMLRQESRAAQSGEAKAWDHLDAEAVLSDRARVLEVAEEKAAALTNQWDSAIPAWDPQYPTSFDVTDFAAGIAAIVQGSQVSQPPELARLGLSVLYQMYRKLNRMGLTPEREKEIVDAIEGFDSAAAAGPMESIGEEGAGPFGKRAAGEEEEEFLGPDGKPLVGAALIEAKAKKKAAEEE